MITDIVFTGTPVTDIKRPRALYEGTLGFRPAMKSAGGMGVDYTPGGATFGIGCYDEFGKPWDRGTCVAFEVDNLDAEISRVKSKRVKFATEVTNTPVCRIAIICDPDGNKTLAHKQKAS